MMATAPAHSLERLAGTGLVQLSGPCRREAGRVAWRGRCPGEWYLRTPAHLTEQLGGTGMQIQRHRDLGMNPRRSDTLLLGTLSVNLACEGGRMHKGRMLAVSTDPAQ